MRRTGWGDRRGALCIGFTLVASYSSKYEKQNMFLLQHNHLKVQPCFLIKQQHDFTQTQHFLN